MQRKWLIGITDYVTPPADIEQQAFPEAEFAFLGNWRASDENKQRWQRADALLVWHWHVDQETVDILDKCQVLVRYGVGYDLLDLDALKRRNLPLCNTPDYGTEEVADTACAMILAIQRKLREYDQMCRHIQTGWQENLIKPHQRTSSQTLGIIGVGRIGTAVVNRMKPFGYKIIGYDPYQPSGHEKAVGYQRTVSLQELLTLADIISIHCPLTDETAGMINTEFLQTMKPGASLVNTARGRILADLDCIEQALRTQHLQAVALDVLPDEPPQAHSLLTAWREHDPDLAGRIIINPHVAYYSGQGWYEMRYKAAETVRMFLMEGQLRNRII